jgi:hypothetical protein
VLCSLQDHLRTGTCDLDHLVFVSTENTDNWHARKGDLKRDFPLDVPIVPSSVSTIASDSECLMCSGFSLGESILLGSFKFIVNYFGGLSLSPRWGDSGAAFMGSTRSWTPPPRWAMIEDSIEEFLMAWSGEGAFGLPSPWWCSIGAPPAPVTTTPWMEDAPTSQAMMTVPPWMVVPWPDTGLPFEQCHAHQWRQQVQACAQ